jgi:hypothetical protein
MRRAGSSFYPSLIQHLILEFGKRLTSSKLINYISQVEFSKGSKYFMKEAVGSEPYLTGFIFCSCLRCTWNIMIWF